MNSLNSDTDLDNLFRQALEPYQRATPPARTRTRVLERVQGEARSWWRKVVARVMGMGTISVLILVGSGIDDSALPAWRPLNSGVTLATDRFLALRFVA